MIEFENQENKIIEEDYGKFVTNHLNVATVQLLVTFVDGAF